VFEKKKNPLDALPKSPFNIDDWKRELLNSENKLAVLQETWPKFDHEGWSLWKLHYIRYEGEGKVDYLTHSLKNGYLRNIEHFRKYTYAVLGVYGVEGDFNIDGFWLWRGTEIPEEWKGHPSYDYFTFTKLDAHDVVNQKLAEEYWLNTKQGDVVEGKPVYHATLLR
jgi:elongation factor 1-gamma